MFVINKTKLKRLAILLIVLVLLINKNSLAKLDSNYLEYVNMYSIQNVDFRTIRYKKIRFAIHNDEMHYAQYNPKSGDSLVFFRKDLVSGKERRISVFIPNLNQKSDDRRSFSAIDFNKDYICFLLSGDYLITLNRDGDNYKFYSFINFEKIGYSFNYFKIKKDKAYLCANYNFNSPYLSKSYNTCIALFDIKKSKIEKQISPNFELIKLTHIAPNHYIDVFSDYVIFSQANKPNLKLFSEKLALIDSIPINILGWNEIEKNIFDSVIKSSSGNIPKWADYIMNKYSRVFFVYGIDRDNLLISWYQNEDSINHAKLSKIDKNWEISFLKGFSIKKIINDTLTISCNDWLLYKNSFADIFTDNEYIYSMHILTDRFPWQMPAHQLKKYEEKYYEYNEPKMFLIKGKVK